jgi:hypothetical protein
MRQKRASEKTISLLFRRKQRRKRNNLAVLVYSSIESQIRSFKQENLSVWHYSADKNKEEQGFAVPCYSGG